MAQEKRKLSQEAIEHRRQAERKNLLAGKGAMDLPFLLLTVLLTAIGLIMLFSASFPSAYYESGNAAYYFKRQLIFAVAGFVAMLFVGKVNYQRWRGAAIPLMAVSAFLLILVVIPGVGVTVNNATRWLGKPGVSPISPAPSSLWARASS